MVRKRASDAGREAAYLQHLNCGPEVLAIGQHWYIMERITPALEVGYGPDLLVRARRLLEQRVWCRAPQEITPEDWLRELLNRLPGIGDFATPRYVVVEPQCLIHGDPTAANMGHLPGSVGLLLIDPKLPGRGIPSNRTVDLGKLVQSWLGWETLLGAGPQSWDNPIANLPHYEQQAALWWCRVHMLRILQREDPMSAVASWARGVAAEIARILA